MALVLPLLGAAFVSRHRPLLSLAILATGVTALSLLSYFSHLIDSDQRSRNSAPQPLARFVVALAVLVVALLVGGAAVATLSTMIAPDSNGYWATWGDLLHPAPPDKVPIRTPFYSMLFATIEAIGAPGLALIALQVVARAAACALIAWLLAQTDLGAAGLVGLLLAADPVSAATSPAYLSESLYTSGVLAAFGVTILLLRSQASGRVLFGSGLLLGWAALFRPSGLGLLPIALLVLWLHVGAIRRVLAALAGTALIVLAAIALNSVRYMMATVAATGLYLSFPLFLQQLYRPDNGPVSAAMHHRLQVCMPQLDYDSIVLANANEVVYTKIRPCLLPLADGDHGRVHEMFRAAYIEAARSRPWFFARQMALESARFLATTASYYTAQPLSFTEVDLGELCRGEGVYRYYTPAFIRFVCPMPVPDPRLRPLVVDLSFSARMLYQPYLLAYDAPLVERSWKETAYPELAGAAGVIYLLFAIAVVRPEYRSPVAAAGIVVVYHAVVTALGQVTITRYVAMVSPFLLIVSGLLLATAVHDVVAIARGARQVLRGRSTPTTGSPSPAAEA
jgi:hypothetical protein